MYDSPELEAMLLHSQCRAQTKAPAERQKISICAQQHALSKDAYSECTYAQSANRMISCLPAKDHVEKCPERGRVSKL